jgi:hypothetical protein
VGLFEAVIRSTVSERDFHWSDDLNSLLELQRSCSKSKCDKKLHKIGVIGGRSGIGKSRALLHLANEFPNWNNAVAPRKWNISIFMTYNKVSP